MGFERFRRRGGGGDRGAVDGDGRHGDGSLETLRSGEIVECFSVWYLVYQNQKTRQPILGLIRFLTIVGVRSGLSTLGSLH